MALLSRVRAPGDDLRLDNRPLVVNNGHVASDPTDEHSGFARSAIGGGGGAGGGREGDPAGPIRVLFADDELVIRRMVAAHLAARSIDAVLAADGAEAMACLAAQRFDILVTDLEMPGMTGRELLSGVAQQYPLLRRIVLTGNATMEAALGALRLGAMAFVPKPIELPVLDAAIDLAAAELRLWRTQMHAIQRRRRGR